MELLITALLLYVGQTVANYYIFKQISDNLNYSFKLADRILELELALKHLKRK